MYSISSHLTSSQQFIVLPHLIVSYPINLNNTHLLAAGEKREKKTRKKPTTTTTAKPNINTSLRLSPKVINT